VNHPQFSTITQGTNGFTDGIIKQVLEADFVSA
jgi:hypothetical protein